MNVLYAVQEALGFVLVQPGFLDIPVGYRGMSVGKFVTGLLAGGSALGSKSLHRYNCSGLSSFVFSEVNATVLSSEFVKAGDDIHIGGGQGRDCMDHIVPEVDLCRVVVQAVTSPRSSVYVEVWLPPGRGTSKPWNQRIVATGNAGLNGCVDYGKLVYLTQDGFAAIGDNGGHDGPSGDPFYNNIEVIRDFSHRARHNAIVLGKQLVREYYATPARRSYHFGCSTAGRQGLQAAQMYPEDFDGILAGAPAIDFQHLAAWAGSFIVHTGMSPRDPRFLTQKQWQNVHDKVMQQCDGALDGAEDGIIEDTSICNFNPEYALCGVPNAGKHCLTNVQVQTVRAIYSPLYGFNNSYIYPRLSPSAEIGALLTGAPGLFTPWFTNAVFKQKDWNPTTLNAFDYDLLDRLDGPYGNISSWSGDLGAFRNRGGKIITYHGGSDPIVSGDNTLRYYRHVAQTMNLTANNMDSFLRHFPISGMSHCQLGPGAWAFGQETTAISHDTENILARLIDWVEGTRPPPDTLLGTRWISDLPTAGIDFQRRHCRYPFRTTFRGGARDPHNVESWDCKFIDDWNVCGGPAHRLPKLC